MPFSKKKKKRFLLRIDLLFPYFPPKIMVISKKKGLHSESNCDLSIFVANFRCSLKKRSALRIKLHLSIFVPKFSDLLITCAITIIFSKSSATLLGFSKFCGTKHKMPICFATHSLRSPVLNDYKICIDVYNFLQSESTSLQYQSHQNLECA